MSAVTGGRSPGRGAGEPAYRGYAATDVVTGEGVAVELPVAGVPSRVLAGLIDVLLALGLIFVGSNVVGILTAAASEAVSATALVLLVVGATVGVPATLETATRGRTLGKLALGLRVVRDDGGPVTARHAITRALVGWVEIYLLVGAPALAAAMVSPRGKRFGDMAAGTYVVTLRAPLRLEAPPLMPPALAGWAAAADVAAMPPRLSVAVRQFLARAGTLSSQSRAELGHELLIAVLPHVAPPPPAWAHPEEVLAAVVAERRRRDLDRLVREDHRRRAVLPTDPFDPHAWLDPRSSRR
jgi:uncharacterized RDD family membrane protein YckC